MCGTITWAATCICTACLAQILSIHACTGWPCCTACVLTKPRRLFEQRWLAGLRHRLGVDQQDVGWQQDERQHGKCQGVQQRLQVELEGKQRHAKVGRWRIHVGLFHTGGPMAEAEQSHNLP